MNNSASTLRFCKKCQCDTDRYAKGGCKACALKRNTAWANANPNKARIYKATWASANPERNKAAKLAWTAANLERKKVINAAWQKANPETRRAYGQNYRASKRASGGVLSQGLSAKLFKLQRGKCPCCNQSLGADFHLDHIIPIALGGANTDDNIQLLRQRCNNQKSAKHPVDFMQSRGFLL